MKQLVLLGRADWRKASDDANPPRLSRTQREQLQPAFSLHAIKPRSLPASESRSGSPPEASAPSPLPAAEISPRQSSAEDPSVVRRRRRRRSLQTAVNPLSAFTPEKLPASKLAVFVEKLFGRRD